MALRPVVVPWASRCQGFETIDHLRVEDVHPSTWRVSLFVQHLAQNLSGEDGSLRHDLQCHRLFAKTNKGADLTFFVLFFPRLSAMDSPFSPPLWRSTRYNTCWPSAPSPAPSECILSCVDMWCLHVSTLPLAVILEMLLSETISVKVAALLSIFLYPYERICSFSYPTVTVIPYKCVLPFLARDDTLAVMLANPELSCSLTCVFYLSEPDLRLEKNIINNGLQPFRSRCM